MIRTDHACCFTGHRIIAKKFQDTLPEQLEIRIRALIKDGFSDFLSGGALGFDTLVAETILRLREEFPQIRLILILPCRDQSKRWTASDRAHYETICQSADLVHYTADHYTPTCMMKRNRFLVDNSSACVFYLTNRRSGTYQTVSYAMEQGKKLYNILSEN